ncbi:hypothetical protein GCM10022211_21710 [Sphingomonas humi]|uniref:DUF1659 domain-containing protein n=1 Tax=Sphingomonas humi TaxID=335630 RepID=A0ABP7S7X5_9SPHN
MNAKHDALAGLLFGGDRKLVNLKLCRGDAPEVSEADLRSEVHFALTQVFLGMSEVHKDFPEDPNAKRVDLAAL